MKSKRLLGFIGLITLVVVMVLSSLFGIGGDKGIPAIKDGMKLGLDIQGGVSIEYDAITDLEGDALKAELDGTRAVMLTRIDSKGLLEPNVTINYDKKRIKVELPGVEDVEEAAAFIGATAKLTFHRMGADFVITPEIREKKEAGTLMIEDLNAVEIMDGGAVKGASSRFVSDIGNYVGYVVDLSLNSEGKSIFEDVTTEFVNSEDKYGYIAIAIDGVVLTYPRADRILRDNPYITGFDETEALNLALQIKSGALPLEIKEATTNLVGPSLGQDALESSIKAGIIGFLLIVLFMVVYYRLPGLIASVALVLYTTIILYSMVALQATLTLPGVLGIVLSLGMAVDANVVIFERLKEELRNGKTVRAAIKYGFKRAMRTIMDANITTLIAAVVLYYFGQGPIKGFATTLAIGILASFLTAIFFTRTLLVTVDGLGFFKNKAFFASTKEKKDRAFTLLNHYKVYFALSLIIILAGAGMFAVNGGFNLGIDFNGGTDLQYNLNEDYDTQDIKDMLKDVQVGDETLDAVYIKTGINETQDKEVIIRTKQSLDVSERAQVTTIIKENFSKVDIRETRQFSPAVSDEIKQAAVISIIIAAIGMLIYITIRFEIIFGLAAVVALIHDVLILLAVYAIFQVPVNSAFIAAVLTVVGYSINDTIVVFDRVRENVKFEKRPDYFEVANRSLGQTISRSINTSLTTLFVIGSLFIFGVDSIKDLAFPLLAGVLAGTYSSIFVASPVWALWKKRKSIKEKHYVEAE